MEGVTTTPRTRGHHVMLVRQWDQQVGGSGCCGRLTSTAAETLCRTGEDPYAAARADMVVMGEVYRALRERFDDDVLEITVVDPRNTTWLLPSVWRQARAGGLSVREALRQVNRATSPCAVVVDGRVVATDPASPQQAVAAVLAELAR